MRSHDGEGPKQFEVGVRGYRREEVDEYVARLHGWLLDSEARAENAVQAATASVGERVTQVLRAALEAGDQARKDSEADATAKMKETEERAAEVIHTAERNAAQLRKRAEAIVREAEEEKAHAIKNAQVEAERAVDDARREIAALQLSIDELTARKATAVAEVAKLQRYLAGTPDVAPAASDASTAPATPTAAPQPASGPAAPATATPVTASAAPAPTAVASTAAPTGNGSVSPMMASPDRPGDSGANKEAVFTHGARPAASA